jgi:hypothetical protein
MVMSKKWILVALIAIIAASVPLDVSQAAKGIPGSGEFAYGAHLSIDGMLVEPALETARNLSLDWIAVDFNWAKYARDPQAEPDWTLLDPVMSFAAQEKVSIMLSIRAAPVWAQTAQGPDPQRTAQLAAQLARRYPGTLAAIEFFPAANTTSGWGVTPNPKAYMDLLSQVHSELRTAGPAILLIASSLKPVSLNTGNEDRDDLSFLQDLYAYGLAEITNIIGLQLCDVTGDPLFIDGQEYRVLRHYEQVRQVMLENNHTVGLIWVTQLCPPSGKINTADQRYQDPQYQVSWLTQAYSLLRAQLYIGAAFYAALNPDPGVSNQGRAIIVDSNHYHLFYLKLRDLIAENSPEAAQARRGRPKEGELIKNRS